MSHLIKKIEHVKPYRLMLSFDTGETLMIDLEEELWEWSHSPNSMFRVLLDPVYFKSVKLNREIKTIYWENGLELCRDPIGKTCSLW